MGFYVGYKFVPTNDEVITAYLVPKVKGLPIPNQAIVEKDIYAVKPESLNWDRVPLLYDHERYYFVKRTPIASGDERDNIYKNTKRTLESGEGFWRKSREVPIFDSENRKVGDVALLNYFSLNNNNGTRNNALKTHFIMHEFTLCGYAFQEWAVCRIKDKSKEGKSRHHPMQVQAVPPPPLIQAPAVPQMQVHAVPPPPLIQVPAVPLMQVQAVPPAPLIQVPAVPLMQVHVIPPPPLIQAPAVPLMQVHAVPPPPLIQAPAVPLMQVHAVPMHPQLPIQAPQPELDVDDSDEFALQLEMELDANSDHQFVSIPTDDQREQQQHPDMDIDDTNGFAIYLEDLIPSDDQPEQQPQPHMDIDGTNNLIPSDDQTEVQQQEPTAEAEVNHHRAQIRIPDRNRVIYEQSETSSLGSWLGSF